MSGTSPPQPEEPAASVPQEAPASAPQTPPASAQREAPVVPDIRFLLANERTLLAWLRTAIALQAGGLAILQFATVEGGSVLGVGLLLLGGACGLFGLVRYRAADRAIRSDEPLGSGKGPELVTIVVTILGVTLALIYLVAELLA